MFTAPTILRLTVKPKSAAYFSSCNLPHLTCSCWNKYLSQHRVGKRTNQSIPYYVHGKITVRKPHIMYRTRIWSGFFFLNTCDATKSLT